MIRKGETYIQVIEEQASEGSDTGDKK
jgi:hypothetical protein